MDDKRLRSDGPIRGGGDAGRYISVEARVSEPGVLAKAGPGIVASLCVICVTGLLWANSTMATHTAEIAHMTRDLSDQGQELDELRAILLNRCEDTRLGADAFDHAAYRGSCSVRQKEI